MPNAAISTVPMNELLAEIKRRTERLNALNARIAALEQELATAKQEVAALENPAPVVAPPPAKPARAPGRPAKAKIPAAPVPKATPVKTPKKTPSTASAPAKPAGKPTLADEISQVMSAGKSMRAEGVVTALVKTRRTKPPKYFRSMVYVALKSDKRFRRVRRGIYVLKNDSRPG